MRECGEIMGVTEELSEDSPGSTGPMGVLDHVFKRLIRFKMLDQVNFFFLFFLLATHKVSRQSVRRSQTKSQYRYIHQYTCVCTQQTNQHTWYDFPQQARGGWETHKQTVFSLKTAIFHNTSPRNTPPTPHCSWTRNDFLAYTLGRDYPALPKT